jgi:hypothetical protein
MLYTIFILGIKGNSSFLYFLGFVIPTILFLLTFKDYKIVIDSERIEFFSLYRGKKVFLWKEIQKIQIKKSTLETKIEGFKKNIYIYTDNEIFTFNIHELQNKEFLETINEISDKYCISLKIDKE